MPDVVPCVFREIALYLKECTEKDNIRKRLTLAIHLFFIHQKQLSTTSLFVYRCSTVTHPIDWRYVHPQSDPLS